jgi:hypothetical protein
VSRFGDFTERLEAAHADEEGRAAFVESLRGMTPGVRAELLAEAGRGGATWRGRRSWPAGFTPPPYPGYPPLSSSFKIVRVIGVSTAATSRVFRFESA